MPKHGTASSEVRPGLGEFLATGAKALYFASSQLSQSELDRWARNSEGMQEAILCAFTMQSQPQPAPAPVVEQPKPEFPAVPKVGEVFELTLDPATEGLALVRAFGYSGNWKLKKGRQPVRQPLTRRFKLVQVGSQSNLDAVAVACREHGPVPEGEFMDAFRKKFPRNDGQGPIGVADDSWVHPPGGARFPYVLVSGDGWRPLFGWAGRARGDDWRWLVEVL